GPKLGVKVKDLNAEARKALRARKGGAMITKVIENTTAEEMQLQINDVIIEVNGHEIQNVNELKEIIDSYPEQKSVHLKYIRYGKKKKTSGVLKEFSLEWEEADMMKIIDLSGLSKE
ncbi:MAG TPA: PDZ domain-containing protein, partial [Chitinophagales bacterium]|nr:PDZ domain-containing protein [Chitinophagales bacterium]